MSTRRSRFAWIAIAAALVLGGTGWWWSARGKSGEVAAGPQAGGGGASAPRPGGAGGAGGPVSVTTVAVQARDVDVMLDATGTVSALSAVEIRPQVSSTITRVHIREGQFVRAGQPLFSLDARGDEVAVARARAQVAKDQAALADAERQLQRTKELVAQNFVSQVALDTNQTLVDSQRAAVAASKAAVEATQVTLSYTRMVAPQAGRVGAINVFAGSLVQPQQAAPLATITQLDPIAVAFALPQRNLTEVLATLRNGGGRVDAVLPEGRGTVTGKLVFVDSSVDATSGTVRVKAEFENDKELLWPGAFVNVRLSVQSLKGASVVPQAAIIQGPRGRFVYVVDAEKKAEPRPVEIVYAAGAEAAVSGVKAGERVVVDGRQNLRPGSSVIERPAGGASAPRGGGGASAPNGKRVDP
jgi:RND family efflux transporter MFP subunit